MKKALSLFLALALCLVALSACGVDDTTSAAENNASAAAGTSSTGSGEGLPAAEVELTFWYPINQESEANWYATMVQKFNQEYAGRIKVNDTANTRGESFAYEDKVSAAAATDSLPDILMADGPNVANYVNANMLIPLEDYFTQEDMDDLMPATIDQGTYNGHFYAMGMGEGVINIYYNKEMLDEAGIEAPKKIEDAWTWEEYYNVCKKLTTDDVYGGNFIQEKSGEWIIVAFQPFLIANDVEMLSADGSQADGYINSAAAVETGEYLQKFADEGLINIDPTATEFQEGRCATKLAGSWLIPGLADADFEWGITFIPQNKSYAGSTTGAWTIGITPGCANPDEAAEFIKYLSTTEACASFTTDGPGYPPVRKSSYELLDMFNSEPYSIIQETLEQSGHARPVTPNYPIYTQKFSEAFYDILLGADVQTSLDSIATAYDDEWSTTYAK